jgi:hypothetical protein
MASNGVLDDRIFAEVINSANAPLDKGIVESVETEIPEPEQPRTFGETVARGAEAGLYGLQSGGQNFNALFNAITGDDIARDRALAKAQDYDSEAATALENIQSWSEFTENPSFSGALTQLAVGMGQAAPSVVTTVAPALATGGTSLLVNFGGRALISGGSKLAARKVIQESAENVAAGVATKAEKKLVDSVYDHLKKYTFKRGAYTGGFAGGYVPLAGQNFSEGIEAGRAPDADLAFRSLAVATPQAALELAAPVALLKSLGKVAKAKSVGNESIMGGLVKDIGRSLIKGGATEGLAETGQETIAVINRFSMDPDYDAAQAKMRIGQAAFMGFAGGLGLGGAGGTVAGGVRATGRIFEKASTKLQEGREQQQDEQDNKERFGDLNSGNTTPEDNGTIAAQLDAVLDPNSTKKAVWIAGRRQKDIESGKVVQLNISGKTVFAAHIPGRGTIMGEKDVVTEVLADGATDDKLGEVLGYSSTKPTEGARVVVQALDAQGRIVSEELTNRENTAAAIEAAKGLSPVGKFNVTSLDRALADRKRRLDAEQAATDTGPEVKGMDIPKDVQEAFAGQGTQEVDFTPENVEVATGETKADPNRTFDNTQSARENFQSEFGEVNWNDPFYAGMTEAFLNNAANSQRNNPEVEVKITEKDGKYSATFESKPLDPLDVDKDGVIRNLLDAADSKFAQGSGVFLVTPDGKTRAINLSQLATVGKQLLARRGDDIYNDDPTEGARRGLSTFLADMQLAKTGYDIKIGNKSIFDIDASKPLSGQVDSDFVAGARIDGSNVTLNDVLQPKQEPTQKPTFRVYGEEFNGIKFDETFDNRKEAEEFRDRVSARGAFVQMTDDKATYFDPTFTEQDTEVEGELGQTDEASRMREQQLFDEEGQPILKTRLNFEDDPKAQNRSRGPQGSRQRKGKAGFLPINYPVGSLGKITGQFINKVNRILKFKKSITALGVRELNAMSEQEIKALFADEKVGNLVYEQYQSLKNSQTAMGRYINFANSHLIIVDNTKGNDLQSALVAAHELGHALFNEEMDNTLERNAVRRKMLDAYEKSDARKDGLDFEEWFADQTAIWAKAIFFKEKKKATGVVQRVFKDVAEKLLKLWNAISPNLQKRFAKERRSDVFSDFIDNTVAAQRENRSLDDAVGARDISYDQKALIREMESATNAKAQEAMAEQMGKLKKIFKSAPGHWFLKKILAEDNILRGISSKIADMFYVQSNAGSKVGFIKSKDHVRGKKFNELEDMLGKDWSTDEVQSALEQAASGTPTADLTGKALEIRQWLESLHDDYISQVPGNDIGKRQDYFPVVLNLAEIYQNPEPFIELILSRKPELTRAEVTKVVDGLVARQAAVLNDTAEITFDATDPVSRIEAARVLTDGIDPADMKRYLEPPEVALLKYLRHVITRTEFKRYTTDENGNDILQQELDKLSPEDRKEAVATIERYLGYTDRPMNPTLQKLQSYAQLFNWVTLLPLATIGSITEIGGAIVNGRELNAFEMAAKALKTRMRNNPEQSIQLARSLGVAYSTAMGNLGLTDADAEYLDPKVRKWSDKFFQKIGLDWFTRFTREYASVMGVEFLTTHADPKTQMDRSERYLNDHGVTAEQVNAWKAQQKEGKNYTFDGPEGEAVKAALQRFVENSMLRPNAAERPAWANDPRYQLIWALKSYLYSFGKVIIGGLKREMGKRLAEGGTTADKLTAIGFTAILAAGAFMPLAMLSLELRELAKVGIAGALPGVEANGRYFRSDRMGYGEYLGEIFDRAGYAGPLSLVGMMFKSQEWGQTGAGAIFGPTVGFLVDDIGMGLYKGKSFFDDIVPARIIPGYNIVL